MIYIDQKVTIWERFELEDDLKEHLFELLKNNQDLDFERIYDWAVDQGADPVAVLLEETLEPMRVGENDGCNTLEICFNNEKVFDNVRKEVTT